MSHSNKDTPFSILYDRLGPVRRHCVSGFNWVETRVTNSGSRQIKYDAIVKRQPTGKYIWGRDDTTLDAIFDEIISEGIIDD